MTSGSSQGLFVIVAVVIFGIFVVISYLLFRDKLQIGLASIFKDSITQTNFNVPNENLLRNTDFTNFKQTWQVSHNGVAEVIGKSSAPDSSSLPSNIINVAKITKSNNNATNVNWGYLAQNSIDSKEINVAKGTTITISAWVYIPDNVKAESVSIGYYDIDNVSGWVDGRVVRIEERNKWVYASFTRAFESDDLQKAFVVGFNNNSDREKLFFYCAGVKVEYGNKATTYTLN